MRGNLVVCCSRAKEGEGESALRRAAKESPPCGEPRVSADGSHGGCQAEPQPTSHALTQPHWPPPPPTQPSPTLSRPTDCLILLFTLAALLGLVGRGGGIHNQLAATRWGAPLAALLGDAS